MRALLLGLVVLAPQIVLPDSTLRRAPRSTWESAGYQQLRFGMGPGDVEDALHEPGIVHSDESLVLKHETPSDGVRIYLVRVPGFELSRCPVQLWLAFYKDRLHWVRILPLDEALQDAEWDRSVRRLLVRKYGKPSACPPPDSAHGYGADACVWNRPGLTIKHIGNPNNSIFYVSPALEEEWWKALRSSRKAYMEDRERTESEKL
jgi:hypothetical protein